MVRIGIIGCGKIAQVRHIPEYSENPDVQLSGFFDLNQQRAQKLAEQYHAKTYSSYDRGIILTASRCADNKTFDELINFMQDEHKGVYFSSKEKAEEFMNWMNKDLPNNLIRVD